MTRNNQDKHKPQRELNSMRECDNVTGLAGNILSAEDKSIAILSLALRGSAGVSREIEQQARELNEAGYDVTLYVLESDMEPPKGVDLEILGTAENFYLNKVNQILYPFRPIKSIKAVKKLVDHDLLIAHRYPLTTFAFYAAKYSSTPYVIWHYHVPEPSSMSGSLEKYFMKSLEYFEEESFIVKNADIACSISDSSRKILKQKSGVNSLVISNNTEDERFNNIEPDFEAISEKYSVQKNDDIVLFVGRLTSSKNVLELIETFQEIKDQIPNGKLVIAGKPTVSEYYETLQDTAKGDVIFTEFVSDEELLALYKLSDIYATCSIREGRNLPPAEAQKYGTPVIGFDVPGIRDIVQDGDLVEEGNYGEFGQSIVKILNES